ncbi:MAG TPA: FtsW/RodA/SpoVE family cell cycle protein [Planctomycetota bacterium]|nr:FtsW/RodA/SpoVE family cell cycle protein [Planctomycetota bacterium]
MTSLSAKAVSGKARSTGAAARTGQSVAADAERSHLRELDWLMLVTVALCCLGLVMAVSVRGAQIDVGPLVAMKQQGSKLLAGLVVFLLAALLPMSLVRRAALPAFLLATACCLAVSFLSPEVKGAHRWIRFGSFQFQPVEPARFFLILAVAWFLARAGSGVSSFRRGFVPTMGCAGLLVGALLLQPDNGNALIVLALASCLSLIGGVRFLHFLPVGLGGLAVFVYAASRHGYVHDRLAGVMQIRPDSQVGLGLIAVGSGGALGRGLGQGWMKMGYVPEAHNDFVFAIIAEEFGFLGSLFVLAAFTAFGFVCYRLVCKVRDPFLRYVVCGYALMVCMQAAVNLLVVSGWAPAKGIDLPFVSTGGTSLMFCLAAVGLIGNAARSDRAGTFSTAEESAVS